MNEEQFRKRLGGALGEPPPTDLRRQLETKLTVGPSRRKSFALGPLAATLALLIVAGFVGWRVLYLRGLLNTGPAAPTIEQIELAQLEARPLHLPALQPTGECPVGPLTNIGAGGGIPAYGSGPVYGVGGSSIATAWGTYFDVTGYTDLHLTGLILMRGRDLKTGQPLVYVGQYATGPVFGTDTIDGKKVQQRLEAVWILGHATPAPTGTSQWRVWKVRQGLAKGESGCTGFQFDGLEFSEVFVSHHTPSP
jgi:hypothetical protein